MYATIWASKMFSYICSPFSTCRPFLYYWLFRVAPLLINFDLIIPAIPHSIFQAWLDVTTVTLTDWWEDLCPGLVGRKLQKFPEEISKGLAWHELAVLVARRAWKMQVHQYIHESTLIYQQYIGCCIGNQANHCWSIMHMILNITHLTSNFPTSDR